MNKYVTDSQAQHEIWKTADKPIRKCCVCDGYQSWHLGSWCPLSLCSLSFALAGDVFDGEIRTYFKLVQSEPTDWVGGLLQMSALWTTEVSDHWERTRADWILSRQILRPESDTEVMLAKTSTEHRYRNTSISNMHNNLHVFFPICVII